MCFVFKVVKECTRDFLKISYQTHPTNLQPPHSSSHEGLARGGMIFTLKIKDKPVKVSIDKGKTGTSAH